MMLTVQYAEAKASYERAIELLSQKGADAVWHAAALEGSASASVLLAKAALTHNSARSMATTTMGGADGGGVAEGGGSLLDASAAYDEALSSAERKLELASSICATKGGRAIEVAVEMGFRWVRLIGECADRERFKLANDAKDLMGTESGELPPPPSPWRSRLKEAAERLRAAQPCSRRRP